MRVLADWRKRAGLTQVELAEQLGVTQARVSTLESGSHPSAELLGRIVEKLDPPAEELKTAIAEMGANSTPAQPQEVAA